MTNRLSEIKARYFPGDAPKSGRFIDWILVEIKGAALRKRVRQGSHRGTRHVQGFLDRVFELLETHDARVFGRIWIKALGEPIDGRAIYTASMQDVFRHFQHLLVQSGSEGIAIVDSRNKSLNAVVSHSIFTQRFKRTGDAYDRMLEMPVYGHSENHAGLQLADLVCSALLFPIAAYTYCTGHVRSVHVSANYSRLKQRYGQRIKKLQYRYPVPSQGRWRGGITVSDPLSHKSSAEMFK